MIDRDAVHDWKGESAMKSRIRKLTAVLMTAVFVMTAFATCAWAEDVGYEMSPVSVPEVPKFRSKLTHRTIAGAEDAVAYAKEMWAMDAFQTEDFSAYVWAAESTEDGEYLVRGWPADDETRCLEAEIGADGEVYRLKNTVSDVDWAQLIFDEWTETDEFVDFRGTLTIQLMIFMENLNPGSPIEFIPTGWNADKGIYPFGYDSSEGYEDQLYMTFYSDAEETWTWRAKFVMQLTPVVRVVEFSERTDVEEGGNG